ncbi:polyprenyl synthetase family protein [Streptomyces sp. NRRL F-4489]|uniref:polyprenyl synthetase family protein n=1 Tax=Streptomyces sp. NRRL F-4489 TaxID=1609095 RepID=UPI001F38ABBE|nr:polyprenyl synthetase family protein [Streptomyces sp. NRRL F-4489]
MRRWIDAVLGDFLAERLRNPVPPGAGAGDLAETVADFVRGGGKRLRPVLCVVGWHATRGLGEPAPEVVGRVAASLEMFHAFALIHDDVMDDSDRRRGRPTVHRAMAARYPPGTRPDAERIGAGAAILAGDLSLAWSDQLLHSAGLRPEQRDAVLPLIDTMRAELVHGQFLDLTTEVRARAAAGRVEAALRVARYKTAAYTVERPLHIGAALAGAPGGLREALSAYALPVGEAFQLRDDLLGVFGDPALTGKPVLDDVRGGKPTVLLAVASERADERQTAVLDACVGRRDLDERGADRVRRVLLDTGAVDTVESMIRERHERAVGALEAMGTSRGPASDVIAPAVRDALRRLADGVRERRG